MVMDDANGGTAAQQHEVRAHTRDGHALSVQSGVGATDALRVASRPAPLALNLLETARTRCGVGVCGVCALARERWGKETTTTFFPDDGVCVSCPCSQDVRTGGVAPTGSAVPLPAGTATATDAAADAVWPRTRFRCVWGRVLRVGGWFGSRGFMGWDEWRMSMAGAYLYQSIRLATVTLGCAARLTGACAIPSDAGEEYADRGGGPRGPTVAAGCLEASV